MFKFKDVLFGKMNEEEQAEFEKFIAESEEHNKKMREECLRQLCENAYNCGMAGIEIDFEKDVYKSCTDFEKTQISNKWIMGKMDTIIKMLERESTK